jgi:hypothetical protein
MNKFILTLIIFKVSLVLNIDSPKIYGLNQRYSCSDKVQFFIKNTAKKGIEIHVGLEDSTDKYNWRVFKEDIMVSDFSKMSVSVALKPGKSTKMTWDPSKTSVISLDSVNTKPFTTCIKGKYRFVINWGNYGSNELTNTLYSPSFLVE